MAETETGIMSRQALGKPLPDLENFKQQIRAWTVNRNKEHLAMDPWMFGNVADHLLTSTVSLEGIRSIIL